MKIPKYTFWTYLQRQKDDQINKLRHLLDIAESQSHQHRIDMDPFQDVLSQCYAAHVQLCLDNQIATRDKLNLDHQYVKMCPELLQSIQKRMISLNGSDDQKTMVNATEQYMVAISKLAYKTGEKNHINTEIDMLKVKIECNREKLDEHPCVLSKIQEVYDQTKEILSQFETNCLIYFDIKEKIMTTKRLMNYKSHNLTQFSNMNTPMSNRTLLKTSMGSFNSSDISVLCSTKIGNMDTTMSTIKGNHNQNNTSVVITSPSYITELNLFGEIPFNKLIKCPEMMPDPFIILKLNDSKIESPEHLLNWRGILNEIQLNCDYHVKLLELDQEIDIKKPKLDDCKFLIIVYIFNFRRMKSLHSLQAI